MSSELKFVYQGMLSRVSFPPNASYVSVIRLALLEFSIPLEYEESVNIKVGGVYPISIDLFEGLLGMEEKPDLEFHIDVCMDTAERTSIKFVYEGNLERIYYSALDTYEDIIEAVFRRFSIPTEYKNFMRLSTGGKYPITPEIFAYQLEMWPSPEMDFHIQINKNAFASHSAALLTAEPLVAAMKRARPIEEKSDQQAKRRKPNGKRG